MRTPGAGLRPTDDASSGSARWEAAGHNGVDEFEIAEFLVQDGAAPAELIKILFGRVPVDA
jgi:hypothetical protein